MTKNIAILGCGWLGLPLAKQLVKNGFTISGSTTSEKKVSELTKAGITPYIISISETSILGPVHSFLVSSSILIINIPPKLRREKSENFVAKMYLLLEEIKKSSIRKVIFISSTAVYGNITGDVFEDTFPNPNTESGRQLLKSEHIFTNCPQFETTIIRFGGLIGPNRHPINQLSGKKNIKNGNYPINLIHLDDCIDIINSIIVQNWWGELFNAVYPLHPDKATYYNSVAIKRKVSPPQYVETTEEIGKKVVSNRLISVKKYVFKTPI